MNTSAIVVNVRTRLKRGTLGIEVKGVIAGFWQTLLNTDARITNLLEGYFMMRDFRLPPRSRLTLEEKRQVVPKRR
jgi:hypothetical protein